MKMTRQFLSLLLTAVLLVSSFAGCGGGDTAADTGDGQAPASAGGETDAGAAGEDTTGLNVFNVGRTSELFDMDASIATEADCLEVVVAITEPLFINDENGVPTLAMAESYEVSDDGLEYTFHIRSQANWRNGDPVTAHDFVYSWQRLVTPAIASEYSFMAEVAAIKNASAIIEGDMDPTELGVRAEDDKTLVVELERPVTFFLSLMTFTSFCPINQAFCEEKGDTYALGADNLLACGPYYMSAWEVGGNTYQLKKNPDYWNADAVECDIINFQILKDSQQTMLAYENGDLDYVRLTGDLIARYQDDPGFRQIEEGYLWFLSPNLNPKSDEYSSGLENENLRKAIGLSIDKDAICYDILLDGSFPADFAVPEKLAVGPDGKDFRETAGTYMQTDKALAQEHWEKAKEELGVDAVDIEFLYEDSDATPLIAQFIQSEVENNLPGVTFTMKSQPKKARTELMQNREYQLGLTRWGPDYADPMTYLEMWVSGATYNYGEWSSADYDELINFANTTTDAEARWQALKDAEALVMDNATIMPIYQKGSAVMVRQGISGIYFHPVGVGTNYTFLKFE